MRILKWVVVLPGAMALVFLASGELSNRVLGYNDYFNPACGLPYSQGSLLYVPYKNHAFDPPTGDYNTAFGAARSNWNQSSTPVWFELSPGQNHTLSVRYAGSGQPSGKTTIVCSGSTRTYTDVELNASVLDYEGQAYKQSVASHELGHHIWLGHSVFSPAVMNVNDNPNSIYTARHDDMCGVDARYPSTTWPNTCTRAYENRNTALNGSLFLCMDVQYHLYDDWRIVWQWDCNGGGNQRLTKINTDSGYFMLQFDHSVKCLDVAWGGLQNGDDIIQYTCTGSDSMQWRYLETNPYRLQNRKSGKCIDVEGQSLNREAIHHQWSCGSQQSQKWNNWLY